MLISPEALPQNARQHSLSILPNVLRCYGCLCRIFRILRGSSAQMLACGEDSAGQLAPVGAIIAHQKCLFPVRDDELSDIHGAAMAVRQLISVVVTLPWLHGGLARRCREISELLAAKSPSLGGHAIIDRELLQAST